jgi:hypothetical protein
MGELGGLFLALGLGLVFASSFARGYGILCCGAAALFLFAGILLVVIGQSRRRAEATPPAWPQAPIAPAYPTVPPPPPPVAAATPRVPFCSRCGSPTAWDTPTGRWTCGACGHVLPEGIPGPGTP